MKRWRVVLRGILLKGLALLFLGYGAIFLTSLVFKHSLHFLSGISPEELDLKNYQTPDPDPTTNFFSALGYDFASPDQDGRFLPADIPPFGPYAGPVGKTSSQNGSDLFWPWIGDFSLLFDLDATASQIRKDFQDPRPRADQVFLAYQAKVLAARSPLEICDVSLSIWRPLFLRLYGALGQPKSVNPFPADQAFQLEGPTMGVLDLIRIAKLLTLESLIDFSRKPPIAKAEPVLASLRISEGLLERPVGLICQIVGLACATFPLHAIWKGVDTSLYQESDLIRIHEQLGRIDLQKNARTVIFQESCFAYQVLSSNLLVFTDPFSRVFSPWITPVVRNFFQGLVVWDVWRTNRSIADQSPFKDEGRSWGFLFPFTRSIAFYNDMVLREVWVRLTRLDVALEIYQRRTGTLPESLEALVPDVCRELPRDPITGKFFGYKKVNPNEYVLYSWWIDQKDDGGIPVAITQPPPKDIMEFLRHQAKGDLVWPPHHAGKN